MDAESRRTRLCHLRKKPDYEGYGFSLRAEKGKPGQVVCAVERGSPAEGAELRDGDRLVAVNGTDVSSVNNHGQVNATDCQLAYSHYTITDTTTGWPKLKYPCIKLAKSWQSCKILL